MPGLFNIQTKPLFQYRKTNGLLKTKNFNLTAFSSLGSSGLGSAGASVGGSSDGVSGVVSDSSVAFESKETS